MDNKLIEIEAKIKAIENIMYCVRILTGYVVSEIREFKNPSIKCKKCDGGIIKKRDDLNEKNNNI